jgi:hypothetical protein
MCSRLTASIDGCLYRVDTRLAWQDAARWLAIPEAELRRVNSAPDATALQAGQHRSSGAASDNSNRKDPS